MKLSELSELHLAVVVAGATFLGGIGSTLLGVFLVDAGTNRQTDVQLVELAIGILSEPLPKDSGSLTSTPETALRAWAVDTVNAAADVKFDSKARQLLIDGEIILPPSLYDLEKIGISNLEKIKDEDLHVFFEYLSRNLGILPDVIGLHPEGDKDAP